MKADAGPRSRPTQCDRILRFIRKHGSISVGEAAWELGIFSLHRRLSDLREQGHIFKDEWVTRRNRDREVMRFKRYTLVLAAASQGELFNG